MGPWESQAMNVQLLTRARHMGHCWSWLTISAQHASQVMPCPQGSKRMLRGASMQTTHRCCSSSPPGSEASDCTAASR